MKAGHTSDANKIKNTNRRKPGTQPDQQRKKAKPGTGEAQIAKTQNAKSRAHKQCKKRKKTKKGKSGTQVTQKGKKTQTGETPGKHWGGNAKGQKPTT